MWKRFLFVSFFTSLSFAQMSHMNSAGMYLMNMGSGTSVNPNSWSMPMLMPHAGSWNFMVMGQAFFVNTQQSSPRGGDKFYSPNAFMFAAGHNLGRGSIQIESMLSLEALTVTDRRYPLLFQTGETAYGEHLVDAQHPHNSFMSFGVHYARPLGEKTMLQLYYAPVGDPAIGPVAFPHRASAYEFPQATLSHHWQDSTHITGNVATVGIKHDWLRLEASGFHGMEPGENRWRIPWGSMDSWSGRVSVTPANDWLFQVSTGRLTHPEEHEPGDVVRTTASVQYSRPAGNGFSWSTSLIWGRNHSTYTGRNANSYLLETLYPFLGKNFATARIEYVDKDELFANDDETEERLARTVGSTFRVGAYTAGYTRDIGTFHSIETGIGANLSFYKVPAAIQPFYGEHPWGATMYLRFRIR